VKKKLIKPIRIFKKPTSLVRLRFYKPETEKIELNPNWKKPSQTGTGFCSKITAPKPVDLNRFKFFLKKKPVWLLFLIKTEPKMITPI
jgi:hypothetical protein